MTPNWRIAVLAGCAGALLAATTYAQTPTTLQRRHTVTVKHAPITNPGDVSDSRSAQQNVAESEQYERLLRTNPAFRKARMQKECGGITDPELRQSCLASFDQH